MVETNIRKNAFWLYGVIIGLAIKEAITGVLPHFYRAPINQLVDHVPELIRLAIFLALSIRFYLGSTHYFDEAYKGAQSQPETGIKAASKNNYGLDFVFGIFHFLMFYALAIAINYDGNGKSEDAISPYIFTILLSIILLYDLPWAMANWANDTLHLIKMWVVLNVLTVIASLIVFGGFWIYSLIKGTSFSYFQAESFALFPVFVISVIDIGELITGKRPLEDGIVWFANKLLSLVSRPVTLNK